MLHLPQVGQGAGILANLTAGCSPGGWGFEFALSTCTLRILPHAANSKSTWKSPNSLLRPPVVYLESAVVRSPHFLAHWRNVVWAQDCRLHVSMMCLETRTLGIFEVIKVARHPVFSRSTNLDSKLIDFFVLLKL